MMQIAEPWVPSPRSVSASITMCSLLEVDPHHDAPARGPADLGEPDGGEDAAAANVELSLGDLLPWPRDQSGSPRGHGRRARGRSRRSGHGYIPCQRLLSRAPFLGTQRVAPISRSMSPTTLRAQQRGVLAQELASFSAQAATASSCVATDVARNRSTSRAAIAPDPAEVTAWR